MRTVCECLVELRGKDCDGEKEFNRCRSASYTHFVALFFADVVTLYPVVPHASCTWSLTDRTSCPKVSDKMCATFVPAMATVSDVDPVPCMCHSATCHFSRKQILNHVTPFTRVTLGGWDSFNSSQHITHRIMNPTRQRDAVEGRSGYRKSHSTSALALLAGNEPRANPIKSRTMRPTKAGGLGRISESGSVVGLDAIAHAGPSKRATNDATLEPAALPLEDAKSWLNDVCLQRPETNALLTLSCARFAHHHAGGSPH